MPLFYGCTQLSFPFRSPLENIARFGYLGGLR